MPAMFSLGFAAARPAGHVLAALSSRTVGHLRAIATRFRSWRDATRLAALDDRMLADIGLTRCDLRDAYAESLWRDPTDVLARRAAERRCARRRSAFEIYAAGGLAPPLGGAVRPWNYPPGHRSPECAM
jgi:uncharacterized protein YjiS (DUF1127 family)